MSEIIVGQERDFIHPNNVSFDERAKQLAEEERAAEEARKQAKKSPYSNFYQFNREHTREMIWLATHYPKANAILLFLLDQMDNYNAVVCSYQVIQEALGIGRTTASNSIKILKERGFIEIYKSGSANVYAVNKNLAWNSWGTNYKYAKFDAKIIISESEQERWADFKLKAEKQKIVTIKKETEKK